MKLLMALATSLVIASGLNAQLSPSGYRVFPEPDGQKLIVTVYDTETGDPIQNTLVKVNRVDNIQLLGSTKTCDEGRALFYLSWDIHEVSIWTEPDDYTFNAKAIGLSGTGFDWEKLPVVPVDLYSSGPINHALGTQGPVTFQGTVWGHTDDPLVGVTGAEVEFWFQFEAPPGMLPYDYEVLVSPRPTWAFVEEAADQFHINVRNLQTGEIVPDPPLQRPIVTRVKLWLYNNIPLRDEWSTGQPWEFTLKSWSHTTRSWVKELTPVTVLDSYAGVLETELEHLSPYIMDGKTEMIRRKKVKSPPSPPQKPPKPTPAPPPPPPPPDPDDITAEEEHFCKYHDGGYCYCGCYNAGSTYTVAAGQSYTTGGGLSGEINGKFGYKAGVLTQVIAKVEMEIGGKFTTSSTHSSTATLTESIEHKIAAGTDAYSHCYSGPFKHMAVWQKTTFKHKGESMGWIAMPVGAYPCLYLTRDHSCDATHPECEGVGGGVFTDEGPCIPGPGD